MIISCGTVVFREFELKRAMDTIRSIGFEYMETQAAVSQQGHIDLVRDDPVKFAELVSMYGFKGVTSLQTPDDMLVSSEKCVDNGILTLEWAAAARIPVVNAGDGIKPEGMTDAAALNFTAHRLEQLLKTAENCGVYLAIEPHGFLLTPDSMTELLESIDSPWLGINYDAANIYRALNTEVKSGLFERKILPDEEETENEVSVLEAIAERVVHFHAKDINTDKKCVPLGEGNVKLGECIRLLQRYDYNGAISLETESGLPFEETAELAKKGFDYLRKLV